MVMSVNVGSNTGPGETTKFASPFSAVAAEGV
jgi:hypothetical protein